MSETKVVNKRSGIPGVYIGRGSPWGNPFIIGRDGTRDEVCDKYIEHYKDNESFKRQIREHLRGTTLVCYCKPLRCHGDWLKEIADGSNL
jgi:hypothetical protein